MDDTSENRAPQVFKPMPTHHQFIDKTGQRFGRFTVLGFAGKRGLTNCWWVRCDCGSVKIVNGPHLVNGHSASCGCLTLERLTRHGKSRDRIYGIYNCMIQRCTNPKNPAYSDYGGRGITVCAEWMESFEKFYADMGDPPSADESIERKNNMLGYSKDNCIWANRTKQQRNTRRNRMLTHNGRTLCMSEWAEVCGINYDTIWSRLRLGWTVERALSQGGEQQNHVARCSEPEEEFQFKSFKRNAK